MANRVFSRFRNHTKVFVLRIGWRVPINALLYTLRSVLNTLAGRASAVDIMLTGSDGVGTAACQTHTQFQFTHTQILQLSYTLWFTRTDFGVIQSSSDQASLCPVVPGRTGITTETSGKKQTVGIDLVSDFLKASFMKYFKILINVS